MYRSSSSEGLFPLFSHKNDKVRHLSREPTRQPISRHIADFIDEDDEDSKQQASQKFFTKPLNSIFSFSSHKSSSSLSDALLDFSTPENPKELQKYLKKVEEIVPDTPPRYRKIAEYLTPSSSKISSMRKSEHYSPMKSMEWNPPPIGQGKRMLNISKDLFFSDRHLKHGIQQIGFISQDEPLIDILAQVRSASVAVQDPVISEEEQEKDTMIQRINRISNSQNSLSSQLYLPKQKKKAVKNKEEEKKEKPKEVTPLSSISDDDEQEFNLSRDPSQDSNRYDPGFVSEQVQYQDGRVSITEKLKNKPQIKVINPVPDFHSIGSYSKQSSVKVSLLPEGDYAQKSIPIKTTKVRVQREDKVKEESDESMTRQQTKKSKQSNKEATRSKKSKEQRIPKQLKEPSKLTIEDSEEESESKEILERKIELIDFKGIQFEIVMQPHYDIALSLPKKGTLKKDLGKNYTELKSTGSVAFLEQYNQQKKEKKEEQKKSKKEKKTKKDEKEEEKQIQKSKESEKKSTQKKIKEIEKQIEPINDRDQWNCDIGGAEDPFYNYSIALQNSQIQSVDECRSTTQTPQKKKLVEKFQEEIQFKYLANEDNYHNFFFPNNLFYSRLAGRKGHIKGLINCLSNQILWPFQNFVYYTRKCQESDIEIVILPLAEINLTDLLREVESYIVRSLIIPNTYYTSQAEPAFQFECNENKQIINEVIQRKEVSNPNRHAVMVRNMSIQRLLQLSIDFA